MEYKLRTISFVRHKKLNYKSIMKNKLNLQGSLTCAPCEEFSGANFIFNKNVFFFFCFILNLVALICPGFIFFSFCIFFTNLIISKKNFQYVCRAKQRPDDKSMVRETKRDINLFCLQFPKAFPQKGTCAFSRLASENFITNFELPYFHYPSFISKFSFILNFFLLVWLFLPRPT